MFASLKKKLAGKDEGIELTGNEIALPVTGEVKSVDQCSDPVFAQRMLGDGAVIIPSEGRVYAPVAGTVSMMFKTGHAIGLTSTSGLELLIHIGLDTVELEGKPFKAKVKQGDAVRAGQLLMEFDIAQIKAAGKSIETPVLVTEAHGGKVALTKWGAVSAKTPFMMVD